MRTISGLKYIRLPKQAAKAVSLSAAPCVKQRFVSVGTKCSAYLTQPLEVIFDVTNEAQEWSQL
jgi:hypothetical protein